MSRFLKALRREAVDCTPVWMMRQAGRYLPEYRALRERHGSFMNLCKNPELACEVTLQPLARFELDAAIIFSDILTIPDAMGLGLHFGKGEGPRFDRPVQTAHAVQALGVPDMASDLGYVSDAIRLVVHELAGKVPLIGFSGSPWTIATYMVEGGSSKNFGVIKRMMFAEPQVLHTLLSVLARAVAEYLQAQILAGVSAVMIFDTWGGVLSTREYTDFSLHYMREIVQHLRNNADTRATPIILFTKNGGQWLEMLADTGCDALGLDWTSDMAKARSRVGQQVALQGNMDPCMLYAKPQRIRDEVTAILEQFGDGPGHVFNLGHGILPDVPIENVEVFIDAVHEQSRKRVKKQCNQV